MRTTTLTIHIEARADDSESRIREALLAQIDTLFAFRKGGATEDGKPIAIVSIEPEQTVERTVTPNVRGSWR